MTTPDPLIPPRRPLPNWPVPGPPPSPPSAPSPPPTTRLPLVVEPLGLSVQERLLEQRLVMLTGRLDDELATEVAAQLLHLDALRDAPVTVRLDCPGGDIGAALVLLDTFAAMGSTVHVVVVGQTAGAGVVVLAAADRRTIYPHARVVLTEPELAAVEGDAARIDALAAEQRRLLDAAYDVVARCCGRDRDQVRDDMQRRRLLTAGEAVDYGIVERVEGVAPASPSGG